MVDTITFLQNLGLPQILLWLLSFAVVNGVLSQAGEKGTPQNKYARGIISMVLAFFIILSAPASLTATLASISSSIVLVLIGILLLIVFIEAAGIKSHIEVPVLDEKGKQVGKAKHSISIFEAYGKHFAAVFLIIAVLIFVNSGGLGTLGLSGIQLSEQSTISIAFFILILIAVFWMLSDPK